MSRRVHRRKTPTPEPVSPTIVRPDHLPSDSWPNSHPDYSPEIHQLACSINYLALRNKCTQLRHGARCIISPKYYVGANNLVREIVFQDGVVWITLFARLDSVGEFASQARLMRKLRPRIPVPEVFAYSDDTKELGGRYLLMEGICGSKAEAEYFIFGIPDRHWNHVLEQLGEIMAEGIAMLWKSFQVNGRVYESDTGFWIDPALQNVEYALCEMKKHHEILAGRLYSKFVAQVHRDMNLIFAELLYLCSELLRPNFRPPDSHRTFPSNVPPFKMENIVFDTEYNVKGLLGFSRTESTSSWEAFQYPFCLEDSFDDPSMSRTIKWMREYFVDACRRTLQSRGLNWHEWQKRELWCKKDKVRLLYEFRTSSARPPELLQRIVSRLYHFDKAITLDLLFHAFLFTIIPVFAQIPTIWDQKPDWYVEMFVRMLSAETKALYTLASMGQLVAKGELNLQSLQLPNFLPTLHAG